MKYQNTLLTFQCKNRKIVALKKIGVEQFSSKELALGTAYNKYEMSYCREKDGHTICCNFQFGWEPTSVTFIYVTKVPNREFLFELDITDKIQRKRLNTLIDELIMINQKRKFGAQGTSYPDNSLQMAEWHQKLSMPKNHRLLQPGEIILETDCEYSDTSYRNKTWHPGVSWYNVGKAVEEGITWKTVGSNGETITIGGGEPSPLICRKMDDPSK